MTLTQCAPYLLQQYHLQRRSDPSVMLVADYFEKPDCSTFINATFDGGRHTAYLPLRIEDLMAEDWEPVQIGGNVGTH